MSVLSSAEGWKALLALPATLISLWFAIHSARTDKGLKRAARVVGGLFSCTVAIIGMRIELNRPRPKDVWSITRDQAVRLKTELADAPRYTFEPFLVNIKISLEPPQAANLARELAEAINGVPNWHAAVAKEIRVPPAVGVSVEVHKDAPESQRAGATVLARALFHIGLSKSADVVPMLRVGEWANEGQILNDSMIEIDIAPNL